MTSSGAWVTVIDRVTALGYEAHKSLTWPVGDAARTAWLKSTGHLPDKGLRRKTGGTGSHCFALYPPSFSVHIDRIIHAIANDIAAEDASQGVLF